MRNPRWGRPTASISSLLQRIISHLKTAFAIKNMGPIRYFLGIDVRRDSDGFFLSQVQYAKSYWSAPA
jgi:hypothetical protein